MTIMVPLHNMFPLPLVLYDISIKERTAHNSTLQPDLGFFGSSEKKTAYK